LSENLPTVIPLATAGAAALGAAVRALWVALVTAPKLECAAEKVILRAERDKAIMERDAERRDHLTTLRLTKQLSKKLGASEGSDSFPPRSS
jgi:hypothetical protein